MTSDARLRAFYELAAGLGGSTDRQQIAAAVFTSARTALGVEWAGLGLMSTSGPALAFASLADSSTSLAANDAAWPDREQSLAAVLQTGEPVFLPAVDVEPDRTAPAGPDEIRCGSTAVVPVKAGPRVIGALILAFGDRRDLDQDDRAFIGALASLCAYALEHGQLPDRSPTPAPAQPGRGVAELVATLTHELRTSLGSILGWSQLLRQGTVPPEDVEKALASIERNAQHQSAVIASAVEVARLLTGQARLDLRHIQLGPMALDAVSRMQADADAKRVVLRTSVDGAGSILGDAARLTAAITDLLASAIRQTPPGESLNVKVETSDSHVRLAVSRAAGSSRMRWQMDYAAAVACHVFEAHGGSMEVSPGLPDQDAVFTVTIPLSSGRSDTSPAVREPGAKPLAGLRVLIVEDDNDVREMIGFAVREAGAAVQTAGSVREAWSRFTAERPDVLLTDIGLPDADGFFLLERIRATERPDGPRLPVLAVTARTMDDARERALRIGFDGYLAKPVDITTLVEEIVRIVGR